jgi:6-phosphogluconolactonase
VAVKPGTGEERITASGRLINNSSKICFIVTGREKAKIVSEIVEKKPGSEHYPASRVDPVSGLTIWMLDAPAASLLKI